MTVKELQDQLKALNPSGNMDSSVVKFILYNGFTEETETYYPEVVEYGFKGEDTWVELW